MNEATTKRCTKCGVTKPVSDFPIRIDRGRRPRSHCRPCHNAVAKLPRSKALQREWRYKVKYGLTVEGAAQMLAAQQGQCGICRTALTPETQHIDHDHETGSVRGCLCALCNKGLGQFKDNPVRLRAAADYLERSDAWLQAAK